MDNRPRSVDNVWAVRIGLGVSSPDTRGESPPHAIFDVMNEYDPERDGELLAAREVCKLLHISRSTLPLWRDRGDLVGYKGRNGHWRYPSHQPALTEALAALRAGA